MRHDRLYFIGTRNSMLAQQQTKIVLQELLKYCPQNSRLLKVHVIPIQTTGDKILDRPLADLGGKALFSKEIQEKLLDGSLDFAVHSLKDMEHTLPPGLCIGAVLPREDPRDILITHYNPQDLMSSPLSSLKRGAVVGTCSPRRTAQLLNQRPDLKIIPLRGNVPTRLQKMITDKLDAIVLAVAGLKRLDLWQQDYPHLTNYPTLRGFPLPLDSFLPAAGQGVLALECRSDDIEIKNLLSWVNHLPTELCIRAERSFLKDFGGNCHTAIAAFARMTSSQELELKVQYAPYTPSPFPLLTKKDSGPADDPESLGRRLAATFK